MKKIGSQVVCGVVAATLLVSGCATTQGGGTVSSQGSDPCDTAKTAAVGAFAGALIGAATGNRRSAVTGAVAGGLIGALACVAINNSSRQTRTAAAVEQDYTRSKGRLPAQPQLVSYQTRVDPTGSIRANSDVRVKTNVEVVRGANDPIREVKEEIVLYDTDNKEFKRSAKILNQGSGGGYETDWNFKLPSGVTQGQYMVKTFVSVNGQVLAQRETRMQLVMLDTGNATVYAAAH
jgi:uncharacterized protein YcfJ